MRRAAAVLVLLAAVIFGAAAASADDGPPRVRWNRKPLPAGEWRSSVVDGAPGSFQLLPPATGEYEARPPYYVR